jgi:hypothetical protein
MNQSRIELFVAAALSGIMGHARSDNPPEVIAARALEIAVAADEACEVCEAAEEKRAEEAREAYLADIRSAPSPLIEADREAAELAELEAATRPEA